jgi:hypothetical protein
MMLQIMSFIYKIDVDFYHMRKNKHHLSDMFELVRQPWILNGQIRYHEINILLEALNHVFMVCDSKIPLA